MKEKQVSSMKIAMVYIGTVVGAGFATGQEILQFFVHFGVNGFLGILLSTFLFVFYGYLIMQMGRKFAAKSHKELVENIGGRFFGLGLDVFIMLSLFFALTAMMAGSGALFLQEFGVSPFVGSAVMGIVSALTVLRGLKGVIDAISAVVPFLLVAVVGICMYAIVTANSGGLQAVEIAGDTNPLMRHFLFAALLYSAYNILMSASILAPLGHTAGNEKTMFYGAAWGGIGLGGASLMIYLALVANFTEILGFEVPLLYLANNISPIVGLLFALVLLAEVYTTAVSALYGLAARHLEKRAYKRSVFVIVGIAFAASLFGFSNLVRYLYPLQGYGGLIFLGILLFALCRHIRWKKS